MQVNSFFSYQRNIAIFISISILLVLWLSVSFWLQAYVEREDAKNIQRFNEQENQLTELSVQLSEQRSLGHRLLNGDLATPASFTDLQNDISATDLEIRNTMASLSKETTSSFSGPELTHRLSALDEHIEKINQHQDTLKGLTNKAEELIVFPDHRNSNLQISLFQEYSDAIQEISDLRQWIHIVPRFTNQDVLLYSELSNSAWDLQEITRQVDTLLEGFAIDQIYMSEQSAARYMNMLDTLKIKADLAVKGLKQQQHMENLSPLLEKQIGYVIDLYKDGYNIKHRAQLQLIQPNPDKITELENWRSDIVVLKQQIELLGDLSSQGLIDNVKSAERTALRNIIIDSLLVFLCLVMAIVALVYFKRVHWQAHHDELTGLANRRMFPFILNRLAEELVSGTESIWLMIIDLDRFKGINDSMGHDVGDLLLKQVADRLETIAKKAGTASVVRLGGDEFAVISSSSEHSDVEKLARELHQGINEPFIINGGVLHIGGSIGISGYPDDVDSTDGLFKASDLSMYAAKNSGRNSIVRFKQSMASDYRLRTRTEHELRAALREQQFELHFQPQISSATVQANGVEALIRWNHPDRGLVSPDEFIPIAEECGLLPQIGEWVLDEACRHASTWARDDDISLRVAVNVSTEQFLESDFVDKVLACLDKYQLESKHLELEVTESVVMADIDTVVDALQKLRQAGIKTALDDFGTGYSSLSYLQKLPLDILKIDKSFVDQIQSNNREYESITKTIAQLAESLNLQTVAEGVETSEQLSFMSALGINIIQGYYYSKPLPAEEVVNVIQSINNSGGGST